VATTDLLARVRTELEQRMAELRPLLSEYERLISAADTLTSIDAAGETQPPAPAPAAAPMATVRRRERRTPARSVRASTEARTEETSAPIAAAASERAAPEQWREEYEREPRPKPATQGEAQQAILAALEHGSHTAAELVMVTAMSGSEIRGSLTRLVRRSKVAKVKRDGDGKSAYALRSAA
jgi:hypothetical protein